MIAMIGRLYYKYIVTKEMHVFDSKKNIIREILQNL